MLYALFYGIFVSMKKKIMIIKKNTVIILLLSFLLFMFSGCRKNSTPVTKTGIYFDTVISITIYDSGKEDILDKCFAEADRYDKLFSKTIPGSDVYRINESYNEWVKISPETMTLITESLSIEDFTEGRFSVMCGALTDLWDIAGRSTPPTDDEINAAMLLCGNKTLDIDESSRSVRINTKGAKLDLGAVAKGYIADKLGTFLEGQGISSGVIQLGGNVLVIGSNPTRPDGSYNIGITEPFSENGGVITAVSINNGSVVTSGNYQRYFTYKDKIYHHIIDLTTGYPAENNLSSVSVIVSESLKADQLSTAFFLLGTNASVRKYEEIYDVEASDSPCGFNIILINDKNEIVYDSYKEHSK